ncbi:acyltransferase family protein [Aestuariimicrobium sp. T2.26MG-19.2B]|uniref:acyltransferase family protein n=1 Tax=Aestuariimicrobium sp. T2.26MG-19.2B TaxID=3040679 RepID=UPI002477A1EC|nr:acyltransferase family protein [Aestuariimicrobium sp. T2.26MG-19.2B]CAI9405436.1 hypothetical protein AESSP_01412 [Aestuariimicrobium sp. T2.26MG-19.2B]
MQSGSARGSSDETSRRGSGEPGHASDHEPGPGRRFVDEMVLSARRAQLAARRALASEGDPIEPEVDDSPPPMRMVPVVASRRALPVDGDRPKLEVVPDPEPEPAHLLTLVPEPDPDPDPTPEPEADRQPSPAATLVTGEPASEVVGYLAVPSGTAPAPVSPEQNSPEQISPGQAGAGQGGPGQVGAGPNGGGEIAATVLPPTTFDLSAPVALDRPEASVGSRAAQAVADRPRTVAQVGAESLPTKTPEQTPPSPATPAAATPPGTDAPPTVDPHRPAARRAMTTAPRRSWRRVLLDLVVHRRPKYSTVRGDIEGLRAIAVIWVVMYHLGVPGIRGGFSGVDVFFVISGFLITGQLIGMVRRRGRLDLADFWSRRLRRLMPAATLVLLSTLLLGWWLLPTSEWDRLSTDGQLATVYVLNWGLTARSVDYLAEDAAPSAFQHYWSLGVEEQFYILWPLTIIVCLLVARKWGRRALPTITVGLGLITVGSALYSWWYTAHDASRAYFSTFTRLWELSIGAMVACGAAGMRRLPRWLAMPLAGAGVTAVVASAFVIGPDDPWPGVMAWLPVAGSAAVLVAGNINDTTGVARALGNPVMRQIGMLSYAIYLWHWPLIAIWTLRHPDAGWFSRVVIVLLTLVLSMLTLRLVEDPIRFAGGFQKHPRRVFVMAAVMLLVTVAVAQVVRHQVPAVAQVDVLGGQATASASAAEPSTSPSSSSSPTPTPTAPLPPLPVTGDYTGALSLVHNSSVEGMPTLRTDLDAAMAVTKPLVPAVAVAAKDVPWVYASGCQRGKTQDTPVRPDQCIVGDPNGTVRVALVGDSKVDQWEPALRVIGARHGWRIQTLAKSGCAFASTPQYPGCNQYNSALLTQLMTDPPDLVITSTYAETQGTTGPGMVDLLSKLKAKGSQVLFIEDNPTPPTQESVYQCVERNSGQNSCRFVPNDGHGTADLRYAARQLDAPVVSMNPWICPPALQLCPVALGNVFIYRQSSHLTNTYVTSLTPLLERSLVEVGALQPPVLPLQPKR